MTLGALSAGLVAIAVGIALRQADRWWFSPARGRHTPDSLRPVMRLQRERLNDVTPVLLLLGHWLEFAGWCVVAVHGGPWGYAVAALAGAVKFRHLQEVSHFAVHGVLVRGGRLNTLLAEAAVHIPLGFVPVSVRRRRTYASTIRTRQSPVPIRTWPNCTRPDYAREQRWCGTCSP